MQNETGMRQTSYSPNICYDSCTELIKNDVKLLKEAIIEHFDMRDLKIVGWADQHTGKQQTGETLAKYYED